MRLDKRQKARLNRALAAFQEAAGELAFVGGKDPEKRDEYLNDFKKARHKFVETIEGLASQAYSRGQTFGIAKGRTREIEARDKARERPNYSLGRGAAWDGWGEPEQAPPQPDKEDDYFDNRFPDKVNR